MNSPRDQQFQRTFHHCVVVGGPFTRAPLDHAVVGQQAVVLQKRTTEGSGGDAKVGELTLRLGLRDFEVAALDHWINELNQ